MNKCQGVCERDAHADNGETAPKCDLWVGHDKDEVVTIEEVNADGIPVIVPGPETLYAQPCVCEGCWESDVAAYEARYERLYYGE
mgnify:FL=1